MSVCLDFVGEFDFIWVTHFVLYFSADGLEPTIKAVNTFWMKGMNILHPLPFLTISKSLS